mmetsp:Transcript_44207/g.102098  ORF Transcript_44207/g.102098 Transcript_44207/m.102098 type:complete len:147 (-) Transcript_44207:418-858(-)
MGQCAFAFRRLRTKEKNACCMAALAIKIDSPTQDAPIWLCKYKEAWSANVIISAPAEVYSKSIVCPSQPASPVTLVHNFVELIAKVMHCGCPTWCLGQTTPGCVDSLLRFLVGDVSGMGDNFDDKVLAVRSGEVVRPAIERHGEVA